MDNDRSAANTVTVQMWDKIKVVQQQPGDAAVRLSVIARSTGKLQNELRVVKRLQKDAVNPPPPKNAKSLKSISL